LNKRGKSIDDFCLPRRSVNTSRDSVNRLFDEELDYNELDLLSQSENLLMQLNSEQRHAFDTIVNTVMSNHPGFFFVSGYGDTGKIFL
jgi:hypothetical protein